MCMLAGLVNIKREDKEGSDLIEQVSKILLARMAESNPHGAGVALSYQDHPGFFTLKSPNSGAALSQILELDKTKPFKHILLHTRYATQGAVSESNSHPHIGPTGALIHNGWCPELYASVKEGWHHNALELQEKLSEFNEDGKFSSDCDSEALSLIFNDNPETFAKNLVGDEVFALAHLDNSGDKVTLFTQYNTVNMMYSHALEAVVFCTSKEPLLAVQDFLGEAWPISEIPQDRAYYFNGDEMTGVKFDFTEASMDNMDRFYAKYYSKNKSNKVFDHSKEIPEDRDDLDTYFKSKDDTYAENPWQRMVLEDGSVVWEHYSGEIIHCDAETIDELESVLQEMPEESEFQRLDSDEDNKDFLDRDFEKVQRAIREQIAEGLKEE